MPHMSSNNNNKCGIESQRIGKELEFTKSAATNENNNKKKWSKTKLENWRENGGRSTLNKWLEYVRAVNADHQQIILEQAFFAIQNDCISFLLLVVLHCFYALEVLAILGIFIIPIVSNASLSKKFYSNQMLFLIQLCQMPNCRHLVFSVEATIRLNYAKICSFYSYNTEICAFR